jgi:alpha-L-rhamnosidase
MMPAIEVVDTIVPLKMTNPQPGVYVYDMGQNFSGWAQLRVSGPRGTTVKLRFAELLYGDGMINTENLRAAKAMDTYTLKGSGTEVYEPRFTYHGFRYVELTGFSGTPRLDTLRGRVVHTAVQPTGGFICSKPILNQLQHIILWGQTTNLHSIPTDCDQRDERLGWLGDAHVTAEEAMMNYDMAAFYTNFLRDIQDEQDSEGALPDVIPGAQYGLRPADPAWGSAYPLITWYMYQRYGDRRILETHYEGIKAWADSLSRKAENHILSFSKYGDWVPIEKTPNSVTSTFYYAYANEVVAKAAEVLGKPDEAQKYRSLASDIKAAFHKKFYDPANEYYATGTQSANTFALFLNMVPEENRGAVMGYLTNNIVYSHDTHVTTGFLGIKYLMEVLTEEGRSDLAYELATQASYPSWGYMMENGATTLWELWQNKTGPSMNSHNHPMFGSVGCWLYQALGGINLDAKEVGYRRIRIAPQMVRDLTWASATVETVRGVVSSEWQRTADRIHLEILIPVGSNAQVLIPKLQMARVNVTEGGKAVWQKGAFQSGVPGIRSAKDETESIVLEVGSGHYSFEIVEEWPSM